MANVFPKIQFELNIPYLVRLHYGSPNLSNGKHGDYYYTSIDVWKPNGSSIEAIDRMLVNFKTGTPPATHYWTLSESFVQLWLAVGLTKNSVFVIKKRSQYSPKKNKEFPYYEIKVVGGKQDGKTFSTLHFRDSDTEIDLSNEREISPDAVHLGNDTPSEFRLQVVNPDVYDLIQDSIKKSVNLITENALEPNLTDVIVLSKMFYYETIKKGWTITKSEDQDVQEQSVNSD